MEESVQNLLEKAKNEEKHRNLAQAIIELEKASVIEPNNKNVVSGLSRLYMVSGNPLRGLRVILNQPAYDKDPDYLLQLSNIYLSLQRFQEAQDVLYQALDIHQTAPLYNNLAVVMMRLNKGDEAVQYLYKSLELNDTNPNTYFNLATWFESKRDFAKAEQVLSKARTKCETKEINDRLVRIFFRLQKIKEAEELIEESLSKYPEAEIFLIAKTRLLLQKNETENALLWIKDISMRKALSQNMETTLLDLKAEALTKLSRFDQSVAVINHILSNPKANPVYILKKANILMVQGNYKEAASVLSQAISQSTLKGNLRQDAILMLRDIEIVNWQKLTEYLLLDPKFKDEFLSNPSYSLESRGIILPIQNVQRVVNDFKKHHASSFQSEQGIG